MVTGAQQMAEALGGAGWRRPFGLAGRGVVVAGAGLAAGLLPPLYGAALAAGATLLGTGIARPFWMLVLLGLAAPLGSAYELNVGPIGLRATEALVAAALLGWGLIVLSRAESFPRVSRWLAPTFLFVVVAFASLSWAPGVPAAAKELLRWVELATVFALAAWLVRTRGQARLVLAVLLLGGLAEGLLGMAQFFLRIGPPSFEIGRFFRAHGTFGQPNPYGGYLNMVLPLALALVIYARRPWVGSAFRGLAFVALIAVSTGLAMSLSRGAWLGAAAGLVVLLMAAGRRTLLAVSLGLFAVALVALLGAFELLPASVVERIGSITRHFGVFDVRDVVLSAENWAIVERMAHWQAAVEMWRASPLLGVGIGQYPVLYPDFSLPAWQDALGHAHNYYLNVLAEVGTIGLIAYMAMLASWLALALHLTWTAQEPFTRAIGLGIVGVVVATATHNVFDNLYVAGMNVHLGLLLGLGLAALGWREERVLD